MKKYNQFINEMQSHSEIHSLFQFRDFEFAINVKNTTEDEKLGIIKEIEKYFEISDSVKKYLNTQYSWAWTFKIHNSFDTNWIDFGIVTTGGWGSGVKYMEDIITPKEFLDVGLSGVKDYIEMKNDTKKYNL